MVTQGFFWAKYFRIFIFGHFFCPIFKFPKYFAQKFSDVLYILFFNLLKETEQYSGINNTTKSCKPIKLAYVYLSNNSRNLAEFCHLCHQNQYSECFAVNLFYILCEKCMNYGNKLFNVILSRISGIILSPNVSIICYTQFCPKKVMLTILKLFFW